MSELDYVGKRMLRKDGPDKVTGKAIYTVDIKLKGQLVGRILRSPHAHARILDIDTRLALAVPGVKAVITGKDTLGIKHGFVETPRYPADQYPLAMDKVRFIGEEVAAVAATDVYAADEALRLIKVTYEPLPAVFDPEDAMMPGAPEIHPSHPKVKEDLVNIGGKTTSGWGDVEAGFQEADYVREDRFESHLRTHGFLEPHATVASFEADGKLNVWTSSQGPFIKRAKIARTLGLPQSSVRVKKAYVGGAFGGKIDLYTHEFCAALLSMKTSRPVEIIATREEIFTAYRHGQPMIVTVKTGVKKDGTIVAQQFKTINNSGGYRGSGVVVIFLVWGFAMAPYRIPHMKYEGYSVYTNNPIRSPQRGHGAPQMRFAVESQLDMIAAELGISPIDIRLKNARVSGEMLPNGDNVHNCGLTDCILDIAKHTDFTAKFGSTRTEKKGRYQKGIGIGVSAYFGGSLIYPNSSSVIVKMNDDGSVSLLTGALDIGQGAETILCQIVAEELKIPMEEVQVFAADTETTPVDIGVWISGNAYVTGNAAREAAGDVRQKLMTLAAEELKADIEDLTFQNKRIYISGQPERSLSYEKLVALSILKHRGDPVIGNGHWRTMRDEPFHPSLATTKGRWTENYAFDAQTAEVEVDTETGNIRLLKAVTAHDCGFPINPLLVEGQIDGQVSMALGHAFMEEIMMEKGRTLNPSWLDYRMPSICNIADSEHIDVITERYQVGKPYRTKEVGEGYVSAILAAIANAVYDAVGVRLYSTPFTPEKVLEGLNNINL
ncbi:xanthine dehydrogenase family protein molybdopterin-binding subunit [Desulfobacula sp.]|uniref:xanthine dehydrogenase family protein molybdopterin-binding subunit n=1 Tax=Desulfobacula sp. TaxID=2593537 RepID=UPI0026356BC2|nr:xanthine dehydrogenase family protein molybdopterin-binding subunit [Desulfobacula sp.]